MPRVLVFDVNETLLDLKGLDPLFARIFGDASVRGQWFAQLIQSALVATVTDHYTSFAQISKAALEMVAARRGLSLSTPDKQAVAQAFASLPPHPEVRASLEQLKAAGLRMAALTNSPLEVAEAQLANAGLYDLFERIFSADQVKRLKPAPEPYRMAAQELGIETSQMRMVAAHAWDIAGALRAGCATTFIARPGMVLDPLVRAPDVIGANMTEVAKRILEVEAPQP
jgi:2-haloacid dehalogenase